MAQNYSVETYRKIEKLFLQLSLYRPMAIDRFEAGTELEYDVTAVEKGNTGKVSLTIEKFVGGGFAGQVYQVRIRDIQTESGPIGGLEKDKLFAMKILIPPSGFSKLFRNFVYWLGFQGPFQPQVNPAAARAGALWQKMIRKGAQVRFGDANTVVDIHAILIDKTMGSCGELSEWIEGRTWRLEVDEHMDYLRLWRRGRKVTPENLESPEYRKKHRFMHDFVTLLHDMGAPEFARQYEWSTLKSQPNCLKRKHTGDDPETGLVAVDFRAGLALLPYLPMSPGDFKLIGKGIARGSLVQFDRGDINKLEQFARSYPDAFENTAEMMDALKINDHEYRESLPDITHNHVRLLYSKSLWGTIIKNYITGWKIKNVISPELADRFQQRKAATIPFFFLGVIPFIGRFFRRLCGQSYWRRHYGSIFSNRDYFKRAVRGKMYEKIISWQRDERLTEKKIRNLLDNLWGCAIHLPLSILPPGLHKFLTDWDYFKDRLAFIFLRPMRLYFNADLREEWLREMVVEGQNKHLLTDEDAKVILAQIEEPYIQKYLKSLAVHICTLPITQVISVIVAAVYVASHPEMPREQSYAIGLGILALFQVIPISPGSLARGLYVVYLVIREKNFKDYNIAVFLSFFKYIGYLAFPIQMAYRYPALARFMAGHWATDAVHIVPVFGERGALMEHSVFCLFYNWPLTIRRKMNSRARMRATKKPRFWHVALWTVLGTALFALIDFLFIQNSGSLPTLRGIWYATLGIPMLAGAFVTLGARGATLGKRIISGVVCGSLMGLFYTLATTMMGNNFDIETGNLIVNFAWRFFIFNVFTVVGILLTEINLPDPEIK